VRVYTPGDGAAWDGGGYQAISTGTHMNRDDSDECPPHIGLESGMLGFGSVLSGGWRLLAAFCLLTSTSIAQIP
jgi:hypothetical protein